MAKMDRKDSMGSPGSGTNPDSASAEPGSGSWTGTAGMAGLPLWAVALAYAAVTVFLFRSFVFSSDMLYGSDTMALGYMARAFLAEELANGNFPLWNPLLLGGTPFLESLAGGDSLYPLSAPMLLFMETYRALGWKLVLHVFIAGMAMYGWTRALGISKPAAFVMGLGYLVAPFFVTLVYPAHDGKMFVIALTPLMFWSVEAYMQSGRGRAWAAIAAMVALVTLTTHFQMAYFLFLAVGIYAFFRMIQLFSDPAPPAFKGKPVPPRAVGRFGLFLVASVVGAGAASVQLLPAVDYIRSDSRRTATTTAADAEMNKAYGASWSMHPEEVMSLVVPEFVGSSVGASEWTDRTYWGRNGFKLNHEYIGLVLMLLAGLSFFGRTRKQLKYFMGAVFVLALAYTLAAHTPIWHIAFAVLPGISLFRAASMAIFLAGFAAITLAGFGLDMILGWSRGKEATPGAVKYLWACLGAMVLLVALAGSDVLFSLWNAVIYSDMDPSRADELQRLKPFILKGAFIGFVLTAATVGSSFLARKRKLGGWALAGIFAVLVTVDGGRVDQPFIGTMDAERLTASDPMTDLLLDRQSEESLFRVLDLTGSGQEVRMAQFGLELASGHHPNDLGRYREVTGLDQASLPVYVLGSENIRRMLNIRYMVWPYELGDPAALGLTQEPLTATQLQDGTPYELLYQFDDLPRARLVSNVTVRPKDEAIATLLDPAFNVETTVVASESPPISLGGGTPVGGVEWVERTTDRSTFSVTTDRASILVLADNWVKGWRARVDGVEVPAMQVNHTLIGVPVQAGQHTVTVSFESDAIGIGLWLTAVSLVLIVAVAGVSFAPPRAPRPAEEGFVRG